MKWRPLLSLKKNEVENEEQEAQNVAGVKAFRNGAAGTVAFENAVEGERRRPKGVSMLALMAFF
jgi:hypothetical protein